MKKIISLFAIVILLGTPALADNNGKTSKKSTASTTSIKGVVLDKLTGEALAGVKVMIPELKQQVYTDLEGKFEFKNISKDSYTIESEMISYENHRQKVDACTNGIVKIVMANK